MLSAVFLGIIYNMAYCSRTTGGTVIRNTIVGFLEAYETPSAVLLASDRDIEADLNPVGLQEVRRCVTHQAMQGFFCAPCFDL